MTNSIAVVNKTGCRKPMVARPWSLVVSTSMTISLALTLVLGIFCVGLLAGANVDTRASDTVVPIGVPAKADANDKKHDQSDITIVVVGDSLSAAYGIDQSQGWVALTGGRLMDEFKRFRVDIVNASVSGDTSTDGLDKFPGILKRHKPDVVLIELGGNDGLRGQPVSIIRDNLNAMISLSREANAHVVLIGIRLPPNYGPRYVGDFEAVYGELSQDDDVALVPFLLEGVAGNADLMQSDGIHPRAPAQPIIVENVWPILIKVLTKLTKKPKN